jgi:hypothetical protein
MLILTAAVRGVAPAIPILRPGSPDLDVSHIREWRDSTLVSVPDTAHPGSQITYFRRNEQHLVDDPQGPAVWLVSTSRTYADSALVLRSTLRPIRELQNYFSRHRRLVFEYDGNRVHIRDSTADSTVKVHEHTYDGEFFHFNELNLVICSLPLRAGYEAILPLYSEGSDELEMDTVKVLGRNEGGAWTIRFADPVIVVTHTLDGTTRRILSSAGGRRPKPPGSSH